MTDAAAWAGGPTSSGDKHFEPMQRAVAGTCARIQGEAEQSGAAGERCCNSVRSRAALGAGPRRRKRVAG